jgi:hypothetical protein
MLDTHWSNTEGNRYMARVVKVLNRQAFSLPGITVKKSDAEFEKYNKGLLTGDLKQAFTDKTRKLWEDAGKDLAREHERLAEVLAWRNGATLPTGRLRRCKYEKCSKFFLAPQSRPGCLYCKPKLCGRNYRALKCMNKKKQRTRRRDLERVKTAMKSIPLDAPGWKERVARKARVTPNFVTYAIRRREIRFEAAS